ncbi:band 4.1-like protein 4B [Oxyura jamaicensis]|uniref:band 4.1-like protein 4B n=1 Tax=Oxyura jamaicensis TaxID=8884 RepID=UPI0015A4F85E|nr:band 4.1-like protein 4B [Oxyura jamaicensis]
MLFFPSLSAKNTPEVHNYQPQYHPNIHPAQPHWHPHTPGNIRPPYHDDRPYWKPPTSGEDNSLRYIQEQNQKNLGEVQSMVYQDKLMTTL